MGKSYSGDIVATEQVTRACGCPALFHAYAIDPYREQRKANMLAKRCPPCGKKANDEHNLQVARKRAAEGKSPKKGNEVKVLPDGCVFHLYLKSGIWTGTLDYYGDIMTDTANGLMSVISKLARKFFRRPVAN